MLLKHSLNHILKDIRTKQENYWAKIKEKEILNLFHDAAKRVPAYKDFLKRNKINPKKIRTLQGFKTVPPTNKDNYLRAYSYKALFWDGQIKKPITIHSTSGSTGEPTYFQREFRFDLRREIIIENFFKLNKASVIEPTLFIITFGMGVWSAGVGIYTAAYLAINRNKLPISIVSPGVSKTEVLKILRNLAPHYKQVIIAGYPAFIKDILDDAAQEGLEIKKMNLRLVFTGEVFPEEFRDYLLSKARIKNIFLDTMNTYGTSEFGATAIETPLAILARRLLHKNKNIFRDLFGNITKTPTLAQYIPYFINFEDDNGELFITGDSPTPLIKYQSGDSGGALTFKQLKRVLSNGGINLYKECKKLGISEQIYKLPFVFVYERKNLTASLYGILIYPEFVKTALFNKRLNQFLTGKFTMLTKYDRHQNQHLEINLELKKGVKLKKGYKKIALKRIVEVLRQKSSEYKELSLNMKERVYPKLIFWPYEYPKYFTPGLKQKWVNRAKIIR